MEEKSLSGNWKNTVGQETARQCVLGNWKKKVYQETGRTKFMRKLKEQIL